MSCLNGMLSKFKRKSDEEDEGGGGGGGRGIYRQTGFATDFFYDATAPNSP